MSWLFSQALVEASLGENFLDGEQSALSNGSNTQQAYCAPDKMMGFSRLSQFGMTYKPLTESRGEELLMSYLEDFHAKTSQPQEKVMDLMVKDQGCGITWRGWLAKYDHNLSLWKTPQCSLLEEEQESLEILPRWGMTRDGLLWEQPILAQITNGTGFGFWESWSTPTTMDHLPPKSEKALMKEATIDRPNRSRPTNLRDQVSNMQNWPTPRTAGMCGGTGSWELLNKNTTKEEARLMGAGNGGKLNPMWVEWLMGWPLGWTDLKPLEMGKFHCVPQQHGES